MILGTWFRSAIWEKNDRIMRSFYCSVIIHCNVERGCNCLLYYRADSRLAPSQWDTSLQSNAVSHWLGANLETVLVLYSLQGLQESWDVLVGDIVSATTPGVRRFSVPHSNIRGRSFCYRSLCGIECAHQLRKKIDISVLRNFGIWSVKVVAGKKKM